MGDAERSSPADALLEAVCQSNPKVVVSLQALVSEIDVLREKHKILLTNGVFDLLHAGHAELLQQARLISDFVVVTIPSDSDVRKQKGAGRPIQSHQDRAALISCFEFVDRVLVYKAGCLEQIIHLIRPNILLKGSDYRGKQIVGGDYVASLGGEVVFAERSGPSTSGLISKCIRTIDQED
ncbi:adenylyltransferase/cytidyltransferase family protein [Gymnodinialimonas mytili]|uniref:adenylyltransferase/cytidyltransferase family protein n=1 Tax=Gymnodinialimonas mytili TaxID=3126503 RepID=UPI003F70D27C